MYLERLQDLNIKIVDITYLPKFIRIKSRSLNSKMTKFDSKIIRELNEEVVKELKIGLSYRIRQDKLVKENGKYEFIWSDVECLNFSQQKARTLDGLFE